MDRLVPMRNATRPIARQRRPPDVEILDGEVSLASSSLIEHALKKRATRAWIDRTNDGLSGLPADGTSLPPKKGGTSARPAGAGLKVRLHQPPGWAKGIECP